MNIQRLKQLVNAMPDEVTTAEFGQIEVEYEDLLAEQRRAEEAELAAIEERAKQLRIKLNIQATIQRSQQVAQASKPTKSPVGDTDFDNGISYEEGTTDNASFQSELKELRQRNVERRRARGH